MTSEEIKQSISMPELMSRYGIEIRRGNMCSCPFHGADRHPSMKVYPDGAHCFTCGWTGDIFKFVMERDNCDFKTAFISLGGEYQHYENKHQNEAVKIRRAAQKNEHKCRQEDEKKFQKALLEAIWICRIVIDNEIYEPYSDEWCECCNELPKLEGAYDCEYLTDEKLNEKEKFYVFRKCQRIRRKFYN